MTTLKDYIRLMRQLPLSEVGRRGSALLLRAARHRLERWRDGRSGTYLLDTTAPDIAFRMRFGGEALPAEIADRLCQEARHAIVHEFDILGSGRVPVHHGMACAGIEGVCHPQQPAVTADAEGAWLQGRVTSANLAESQRIWRLIRSGVWAQPDYRPIDWQIDIRSGYRWSELSYYADIQIGPARGADIKLPWELARMQHLPQLAQAARLGETSAETEIRAQILDFIASNPPRHGVNWKGPMDVAIRAVNWLVALGIMQDGGCAYDAEFRAVVGRSLLEHGQHVLQHLEWSEEPRSNHYLANITGLLFIAAHLPATPLTNGWLGFATREFLIELQRQFHPDGSNYEASTGYHRLSSEMALFGSALLLGLDPTVQQQVAQPQPRLAVRPPQPGKALPLHALPDGTQTLLPATLWPLLERMAEFTADILKPDCRPILIGDQDSGRLLKLDPSTASPHDHRGLLRLAGALFGRPDLTAAGGGRGIESQALDALSRQRFLPASGDRFPARHCRIGPDSAPALPQAPVARHISLHLPAGSTVGQQLAGYPDFGLYVLRSERLFCALRCFDPAVSGIWGHSHDDNLSIELVIDGVDYIVDPGTYVYTSIPEYRDLYRSAAAHFTPRPANRTALQTAGPFTARQIARATCRQFGPQGFSAILTGPDWTAERTVVLGENSLDIFDAVSPAPLAAPPSPDQRPTVTDGYGCKTTRPAYLF